MALRRYVLKLQGVQPFILAVLFEQIVMGTDLDDPPAIHDDDAIGVLNRGQAVRDDQRRAVVH